MKTEAGRELDARIAEAVFGYTLDYEFADLHVPPAPHVKELRDQYDEWGILPAYSSDIAAAWLVVEKAQTWSEDHFMAFCEFLYDHGMRDGWGSCWLLEKSASEAAALICRAALEALHVPPRS